MHTLFRSQDRQNIDPPTKEHGPSILDPDRDRVCNFACALEPPCSAREQAEMTETILTIIDGKRGLLLASCRTFLIVGGLELVAGHDEGENGSHVELHLRRQACFGRPVCGGAEKSLHFSVYLHVRLSARSSTLHVPLIAHTIAPTPYDTSYDGYGSSCRSLMTCTSFPARRHPPHLPLHPCSTSSPTAYPSRPTSPAPDQASRHTMLYQMHSIHPWRPRSAPSLLPSPPLPPLPLAHLPTSRPLHPHLVLHPALMLLPSRIRSPRPHMTPHMMDTGPPVAP